MTNSQVIVFGSINMDLVATASRLPRPGETIPGDNFSTIPGGKGANQAVALTRLGISTSMIGRVGNDSFGQDLLTSLKNNGVNTDGVLVDEKHHTGVAMITVVTGGENQIIVIPGANGKVNQEDLLRLKQQLPGTSFLLLQLEIPLNIVESAIKIAHQLSIQVILDPAPVCNLSLDIYPLLDMITPNATEAEELVGFPVVNPDDAADAATILRQRGVKTAIIKLGSQGVYCDTAEEKFFVPAFQVEAVDTVAAGDAFNGGLTTALMEGLPLRQAVIWGAAAGAISVTKSGAQSSLPSRQTFQAFLAQQM
ncbi:MAG: ribokinase [Moorea sp. SIO2B7]|nr:ribokinase [Moorena sp. SIO2B7]